MSDPKYYGTGRGGYGNVRKGDKTDAVEAYNVPLTTSTSKGKYYSVGRGGAGNMRDNDKNQLADEISEDKQIDNKMMPVSSPTIGRGGYGNVKAGQNSAAQLFNKAKGLFTHKDS